MTKYIAMICGHNSGRSQMAQAIFNRVKQLVPSVDAAYEAISWGTGVTPGSGINEKIVAPLQSIGIELDRAAHFAKNPDHPSISSKLGDVTHAFTMGCMDNCSILPAGMNITNGDLGDWNLDDPAKPDTDVTAVRDTIIGHSLELVYKLAKR